MKANELRIGNYFLRNNIASQVHPSIIEDVFNGKTNINPIPLTEEWLLKFGFSDKEYKKDYIGIDFESSGMYFDFVLSKPFSKGEWNNSYTFNLESHRFCKVEYVHSLQNLYFTLTGEELVVKE